MIKKRNLAEYNRNVKTHSCKKILIFLVATHESTTIDILFILTMPAYFLIDKGSFRVSKTEESCITHTINTNEADNHL